MFLFVRCKEDIKKKNFKKILWNVNVESCFICFCDYVLMYLRYF